MRSIRRIARPLVVLSALMLAVTGCAGDVGKYRERAGTGALAAKGGVGSASDTTDGLGIPAPGPGAGALAADEGAGISAPSPGAGAQGAAGSSAGRTSPAGSADGEATPGAPPPAIGASPASGKGSTVGVTDQKLILGLLYPRSGAYSAIARNWLPVVQAAFDDVGKINGRNVVVKGYDDGTSNAAMVQTAEKQAAREVFTFMSMISESNIVLAPLANRDRLPVLLGNMDERVARPLHYAFSLLPYWSQQAKILPSFIENVMKSGDKKIGVVYETTSTATDAKNIFRETARAAGLQVVFEQPVAQNQSSCANEAANMQAKGAEVVFLMTGPLGAICMLRDSRALGYQPRWTGVGASWNATVVAKASGGAATGSQVIAGTTTLETEAGKRYSRFVQRRGLSGADTDVDLVAYAMAQTWIKALQEAGRDVGRDSFVRTMETKLAGFDSGYLPPPKFAAGDRSGPVGVVGQFCEGDRWVTRQAGWRTGF